MSVRLNIEVSCDDDGLTYDEASDEAEKAIEAMDGLTNAVLRKVHIY